jgi:hypothetical protein
VSSITNANQPVWSVPDVEARQAIPKQGFIKDYLEFMMKDCDAPVMFHFGTVMTTLAAALADTDIVCQWKDGTYFKLPMILWSVVVGLSGDRKSSAMRVGVDLLIRARSVTDNPDVLLPNDGSVEALTDCLIASNNAMIYRDEVATLFDASRRGYSEGTQHWLLTLESGKPYSRVTRQDTAGKKKDEDGGSVKGDGTSQGRIIERPRVCILGAIPPDVFKNKSNSGDWRSGFLARCVFWPGWRERYELPRTNEDQERMLSQWLVKFIKGHKGNLIIPPKYSHAIVDWVLEEVEPLRGHIPDGLQSHFTRYQDLGMRLLILYARSRYGYYKGAITIEEDDLKRTLALLTIMKKYSSILFRESQLSVEGTEENDILSILEEAKRELSLPDLCKRLPNLSKRKISAIMKTLTDARIINRKPDSSRGSGRRPWLYFV